MVCVGASSDQQTAVVDSSNPSSVGVTFRDPVMMSIRLQLSQEALTSDQIALFDQYLASLAVPPDVPLDMPI
jgi:hypothetical protein